MENDLHPIFAELHMQQLRPADFDSAVGQPESLVGVFFWGHQCPNCEIAKRVLHENTDLVHELGFTWFHVNTYEDMDLGTRFGLHGIPTFLFFNKGKKLGRISPFPGIEPFLTALHELKAKHN